MADQLVKNGNSCIGCSDLGLPAKCWGCGNLTKNCKTEDVGECEGCFARPKCPRFLDLKKNVGVSNMLAFQKKYFPESVGKQCPCCNQDIRPKEEGGEVMNERDNIRDDAMFPATKCTYWQGVSISCCEEHALQIKSVGLVMGVSLSFTDASEGAVCANCVNEKGEVKP